MIDTAILQFGFAALAALVLWKYVAASIAAKDRKIEELEARIQALEKTLVESERARTERLETVIHSLTRAMAGPCPRFSDLQIKDQDRHG